MPADFIAALREENEVLREQVRQRQRAYPQRVEAVQLTRQLADQQTAVMQAIATKQRAEADAEGSMGAPSSSLHAVSAGSRQGLSTVVEIVRDRLDGVCHRGVFCQPKGDLLQGDEFLCQDIKRDRVEAGSPSPFDKVASMPQAVDRLLQLLRCKTENIWGGLKSFCFLKQSVFPAISLRYSPNFLHANLCKFGFTFKPAAVTSIPGADGGRTMLSHASTMIQGALRPCGSSQFDWIGLRPRLNAMHHPACTQLGTQFGHRSSEHQHRERQSKNGQRVPNGIGILRAGPCDQPADADEAYGHKERHRQIRHRSLRLDPAQLGGMALAKIPSPTSSLSTGR